MRLFHLGTLAHIVLLTQIVVYDTVGYWGWTVIAPVYVTLKKLLTSTTVLYCCHIACWVLLLLEWENFSKQGLVCVWTVARQARYVMVIWRVNISTQIIAKPSPEHIMRVANRVWEREDSMMIIIKWNKWTKLDQSSSSLSSKSVPWHTHKSPPTVVERYQLGELKSFSTNLEAYIIGRKNWNCGAKVVGTFDFVFIRNTRTLVKIFERSWERRLQQSIIVVRSSSIQIWLQCPPHPFSANGKLIRDFLFIVFIPCSQESIHFSFLYILRRTLSTPL